MTPAARGTAAIAPSRAAGPRAAAFRWPLARRVAFALAVLAVLAMALLHRAGLGRQGWGWLLGIGLGFALHRSAFGFTAGWRSLIRGHSATPFAAQLALILGTSLIYAMLFDLTQVRLAPVGVSIVIGAAIFGIGMQLGNGCGSGTLFAVGGGSVRMLVTLGAFIAGSLAATLWGGPVTTLPAFPATTLAFVAGEPAALALQALACGALILAAGAWVRRCGQAAGRAVQPGSGALWSLGTGAAAIAMLAVTYRLMTGEYWSITFAFAVWGAKIAAGLGLDLTSWPFWASAGGQRLLAMPLTHHTQSMADLGLILGASLSALWADRFRPRLAIPARSLAAALLGGLLMGVGARLGHGCNIGAYYTGIAVTSLHGWLWLPAAFAGAILGVRLRPRFGLDARA